MESEEFRIIHSGGTIEMEGQANAATEAKTMSQRRGGRVTVERVDGRVQMQYRDGELISYHYETRDRRSV